MNTSILKLNIVKTRNIASWQKSKRQRTGINVLASMTEIDRLLLYVKQKFVPIQIPLRDG